MMMPRLFGEDLFDDFMTPFENSFFTNHNPLMGKRERNMMKTDIKEKDGNYILDMDLPGCKKEDVSLKLENGYLTVGAQRAIDKDEKDDNGNYIRRERYSGSCQRSFYVGEDITHEDIKAKFENGTLKLDIPKKEAQPKVEQKKTIAIE